MHRRDKTLRQLGPRQCIFNKRFQVRIINLLIFLVKDLLYPIFFNSYYLKTTTYYNYKLEILKLQYFKSCSKACPKTDYGKDFDTVLQYNIIRILLEINYEWLPIKITSILKVLDDTELYGTVET